MIRQKKFTTITKTFGKSPKLIKMFAKKTNGIIRDTVEQTIIANQTSEVEYNMTAKQAEIYLKSKLSKDQILSMAKNGLIRYSHNPTAKGRARVFKLCKSDIDNINTLIDCYYRFLRNPDKKSQTIINYYSYQHPEFRQYATI